MSVMYFHTLGPERYCSPRHRMPFKSINERSNKGSVFEGSNALDEVVGNIWESLPHVGVAVFPQALVIEPVHLRVGEPTATPNTVNTMA